MTPPRSLAHGRLRTPRAAAVAGILFSGLMIAAFLLFLSAVLRDSREHGSWLVASQWVDWTFIVFPVWALLISVYLLVTSLRQEAGGRRTARSVP